MSVLAIPAALPPVITSYSIHYTKLYESDAITEGKDSWGTWDTLAREEIFSLIEKENIAGVLLISGDRHGARGFTIPRPSGFRFYEFEAASLGGVPGPVAMADNPTNQLFGYDGLGLKAFGEFTFHTDEDEPRITSYNVCYTKLLRLSCP